MDQVIPHPLVKSQLPPNWRVTIVDEIKDIQKSSCVAGPFGSSISSKYFVESGVPIIRGNNIRDDRSSRFVDEGFAFVTSEQAEKYKAQHVIGGDLVFTCWGTLGQVGLIPNDGAYSRYIISNKQLKLRPNPKIADPLYLFYHFSMQEMVEYIKSKAVGAAVPGINLGILKRLPVILPPLEEQRRIASILGAYDDLIQVNRRRIALLEEMARRLFEEWFVHFRFPGHEAVAFANGKPAGWLSAPIASVCSKYDDGDWLETKDQGGTDFRIVQISNIGMNCFVETGNWRGITQATFDRLNCQEILPGDMVVSRMPRPIGRAWMAWKMPFRMVTAVDGAIVRANTRKVSPYYLLFHINSEQNVRLCEVNATGTTRPRITRRAMGQLPILLPPMSLQEQFAKVAELTNEMRRVLFAETERLECARDLLLPRLISGELSVTAGERELKAAA